MRGRLRSERNQLARARRHYLTRQLKNLWFGQEGDSLAEYALLLVLVVATACAAEAGFAASLLTLYSSASSRVTAATKHALGSEGLFDSPQSINTGPSNSDQGNQNDTTAITVHVSKP